MELTNSLRPVHNTPEEFENGGFTLKTHQMFSFRVTPEEFKNATITGHVGLVFEENSAGKSHDYRDVTVVWTVGLTVEIKLRFQITPPQF